MRTLSIMAVVLLTPVFLVGCQLLKNQPAEIQAQVWLNEIDGWLGTIEQAFAAFTDAEEPSKISENLTAAKQIFAILRPRIEATIKNLALLQAVDDSINTTAVVERLYAIDVLAGVTVTNVSSAPSVNLEHLEPAI